jgi:flagellar biosynthetic protein FliR
MPDVLEPLLLQHLGPIWATVGGTLALSIARFVGLACTAPLVSSPVVPWRIRLALAATLGCCCGLGLSASNSSPIAWNIEIVWLSVAEVALGAAIGLGARLLLAGLEFAAGLIDSQSGVGQGSVLNPGDGSETTVTGAMLALLSGLTWLLLAPIGGDLRIVAALLDSLQSLPVGSITTLDSPVEGLRRVLSAACVFGLQVAAPVVISVGLLQSLWCVLSRSRGGGVWQPALSPLRTLLALLVLAATVTELGDAIAGRFEALFNAAPTVAAWEASP